MTTYKREYFCTLLDAIDDYAFLLDNEGHLVEMNNTLLMKLGFTKEELLGKTISFINPANQERDILKSIKTLSKGDLSFNIRTNITTREGIEIPVEAKLVMGEWDEKPAFYVTAKEINDYIVTNIKKTKRDSLISKIKYKQLIEGLDEAFFILKGSKIIYLSPAFHKIFGVEAESPLNEIKSIFKLVHPEDKRYMLRVFIKNRKFTNQLMNESFRIIRPDGEVRWLWIKDFLIDGENDENIRCGIILDITSQKQIEVRTMDLERQIHLESLRSEFFSNISHELRTPINIITSTIQLLHKNYIKQDQLSDSAKINRYFRAINQNSFRLLRIVNNIIDITRIDAGFIEPHYRNYNIVSVIEDIAISVSEYLEEKGISLIFDTDVEEKIIAIDKEKIERVLLNLISNAIKQTDPGGSLWINVYDRDTTVAVSVKDNGTGIDPSMQNAIFEKFGQVDKSLTRRAEGSGIGLYLTKALVEMHKGNISVKSTVGEGSEFIFELPAVLCKEDVSEKNKYQEECKTLIQKINIEFSDIYM